MGNIGSKLLLPAKGIFKPVKQLIKCIGKLVDFIISVSKLDTAGKILFCLNFLHGLRDSADRSERSSRKEISDHCGQHNQKRKYDHCEMDRNPETGFCIRDRGNPADIDESVTGDPVGQIKHVPPLTGISQRLKLAVGKFRIQIKPIGNPAVQKISGFRIQRQIHAAVQIIKIRIHIKGTVFPFNIFHAFLHLFFQRILRGGKDFLIAQRK